MNRLSLALLLSSSLGLAAVACGGISDPTQGSERVATVSGALTGTSVPANARVALVYRKASSNPGAAAPVEVASDVPVVAGKFTMNLGEPSADYFEVVGNQAPLASGGNPPPRAEEQPVAEPAPAPAGGSTSSGGGGHAGNVGTRGGVVSGSITEPMSAAIAGFVVYADTNGNGKLDLEGQWASTPDQILGGNSELILVYLKDGGALDYEKMRDKSGILPTAGFNLAWTEGRWLPLNVVELKLSATTSLPSPVCSSSSSAVGGGSGSGSGGSTTFPGAPADPDSAGSRGNASSDAGVPSTYPAPGDPGLKCSPDGRSFSYTSGPTCPPYEPPPPPVGLCASTYFGVDDVAPCASGGYGSAIPDGAPVPDGWPCPVADGGAIDGGSFDASTDGGAADGGAADGG